jgi:2,3-bisphosphoglycerate-independent phosphoglycerate mutase
VDLSKFGVEFIFRSGAGHRAALALKGEGIGHCVTSNDPKKEGVKPLTVSAIKKTPAHEKTAAVCNEFVRQSTKILFEHQMNRDRLAKNLNPANVVLMRGAGEMGNFEPFPAKYGLSGSVISAASLITGIGRVVGLPHVEVPGATGSQGSNVAGKVSAALSELKTKDFVLMNIKGADESGHDGLAEQKRDFIERIDPLLEPLLGLKDTVIIICADHSTPCTIKDHSADPVPVLIHGEGVRADDVMRFDEYACAKGGLNRITGAALMPTALDLINKAHKFGA